MMLYLLMCVCDVVVFVVVVGGDGGDVVVGVADCVVGCDSDGRDDCDDDVVYVVGVVNVAVSVVIVDVVSVAVVVVCVD